MSIALNTYELEKLIESRQNDLARQLQRRLLLPARQWVTEQSMQMEPDVRVSRASGGRC